MKKYLVIPGMIIGIFLNVQLSTAQDTPADDSGETLEYTYGSVVSVSPVQVIISEYNYESDEEVQVSYTINPETKFNNMTGVPDLTKEDNVDIYYKIVGDQKVATMITKDATVYENEEEYEQIGEDEVVNELSNETLSPPPSLEIENSIDVDDTRG